MKDVFMQVGDLVLSVEQMLAKLHEECQKTWRGRLCWRLVTVYMWLWKRFTK